MSILILLYAPNSVVMIFVPSMKVAERYRIRQRFLNALADTFKGHNNLQPKKETGLPSKLPYADDSTVFVIKVFVSRIWLPAHFFLSSFKPVLCFTAQFPFIWWSFARNKLHMKWSFRWERLVLWRVSIGRLHSTYKKYIPAKLDFIKDKTWQNRTIKQCFWKDRNLNK